MLVEENKRLKVEVARLSKLSPDQVQRVYPSNSSGKFPMRFGLIDTSLRVDRFFHRLDIRTAIASLSEETGATIVLPPEFEGEISLSAIDVPWVELVEDIAKIVKHVVIWEDHRTLRVVPRKEFEGSMETRIYVVGDLDLGEGGLALLRTVIEQRLSRSATGKPFSPVQYDKDHATLVVTDTMEVLDPINTLMATIKKK